MRPEIDRLYLVDEDAMIRSLVDAAALSAADRAAITDRAARRVRQIRDTADPGLMEVFLAQYGLSTDEGIALMCLAEALLRVPDADTIDALIEDKIAPSDWGRHLGQSASSLVNASTWALMLTGKVLVDERPGPVGHLRGAIKRLGEPVIRTAVSRAMKEMGRQFVLGEDIHRAMERAAGMEAQGFTYSYDMLGEAARTDSDARAYHLSYSRAISAIASACTDRSVETNPGISVKLSALHPRYEEAQRARVLAELVPRVRSLALLAKSAGQGFNVDAEEADRLSLSLDVIDAVVSDPALAGWDGFGVVVQAYGPRCGAVIDWLYDLAGRNDRRLMVRLVKGAYWDAEIKRAQALGLAGFLVFTAKSATDISYVSNARKLLGMTDRLYPQFATHNAQTVETVLRMAETSATPTNAFEFQRLHGMGEVLHRLVMAEHGTRCRIYAPVGAHKDLLAYLVRRLLENGANSSFVNQIVDADVPPEIVAADPFDMPRIDAPIATGPQLFQPDRANSTGWDVTHRPTLAGINAARDPHRGTEWEARPLLASAWQQGAEHTARGVRNPANPGETVGSVIDATPRDAAAALEAARPWTVPVGDRAGVLRQAAAVYEAHAGELFALLHREAGKTLPDAVGEVREAVDFLHYYAAQAEAEATAAPRGVWVCISPWNFPLAIFTGQLAAALATGNAVLAKPAEQTCLIAHRAVSLLHAAGVPRTALQMLPGAGELGAALTGASPIDGVAFTGSIETARRIRASLARDGRPGRPLIAETGGLNAMVLDSTALPEHAVRDIVQSAFQSAGQRCSALRCLYVQEDVAEDVLEMLQGAMAELSLGDPWHLSTDIGPVIDEEARAPILAHIEKARAEGRLIAQGDQPDQGIFVPPTVISVSGIGELEQEIFGPVLHVARFRSENLPKVLADINRTGYGLTFGLHTRIDDRVQEIVEAMKVGNIYVNRNQIGAVVGSQPFGGEGLSGTGPKAGGPNYLPRFRAPRHGLTGTDWPHPDSAGRLAAALAEAVRCHVEIDIAPLDLPGPTGESNRLSLRLRGPVLCLGPGAAAAAAQARAVEELGGIAVQAAGSLAPEVLTELPLHGVLWWGDDATGRALELSLAARPGPLVPLVTAHPDRAHLFHERHVCIDTTAAGGNAALLAEVSAPRAAA